MVKVLHLSDLHLGSGLAYGRINPASGINTRLEDFASTLEHCMDHAIQQGVDLVLFGGDAFPDATPPPLHQEIFARQFRRLADAHIPTVLLVGNHDQYGLGQEGSSLTIYRTLGVEGFIVGDRLQTFRIETASGPVQVTTLPWLTRSTLLARQDTVGIPAEVVSQQLLQRLHLALEAEIRQLDPKIPAILLVHAMVDTARYGSERHLAVGKGFTVPLSLLARPAYHYVALGHVHRHQVLCQDPLVIYPGSLERVDFGEEQETKGFVLAEVQLRQTCYEFVPCPARAFRTVRVDLACLPLDSSPSQLQTCLRNTIAEAEVGDAIVRLIYRVRPDQLEVLEETALHTALASAFSYTIAPEMVVPTRARLPTLDPNRVEPLQALEQYLQTREDLAGLRADMLAAAQQLVQMDGPELDYGDLEAEDQAYDGVPPYAEQLRLL
jgi:exonuclease SbcD